mmetsp:Transcript_2044/g.5941  ORF Transcript_2044/g.5941 Transcript_2044/m.5941 type:complete len:439 (-) Transcript_2044:184-1500(-)
MRGHHHAYTQAYELVEPMESRDPAEKVLDAEVAGGKLVTILMNLEKRCSLSPSVYDAAIVMPQIARSAGHPKSLVHLAIRSYVFLVVNLALQGFLLYMICTEEHVMDRYAGQMHLCDFGANVQDCPDGPNCVGPGGTNYVTPGRMYGYDVWSTRRFVRQALTGLFPDKEQEIMDRVDPGEYGVENNYVRWVCVFIFTMSVMHDLRGSIDMIRILWRLPSSSDSWIEYSVPSWASKEEVKERTGKSDIDFVSFQMAGMPLPWKIVSWVVVIIPKLLIWRSTAISGVNFLMETSGIDDVIVNVTALSFILNLDETIFDLFAHKAVHHIIENLEPMVMNNTSDGEDDTPEECAAALRRDRSRTFFDPNFLPYRLIATVFLAAFLVFNYYLTHCQRNNEGGLVSKAMGLPKTVVYPFLSFMFPWLAPAPMGELYWSFKPQET